MAPLYDYSAGKFIRQDVYLKAVYTDTNVYLLVQWEDFTENLTAQSWLWDKKGKKYIKGKDHSDLVVVEFFHGDGVKSIHNIKEYNADLWCWDASVSVKTGTAIDKSRKVASDKLSNDALEKKAGKKKRFWINDFNDAGTPSYKLQSCPKKYSKGFVPLILPQKPSGSSADIQANGVWEKGIWTVEFQRKLKTGFADDVQFNVNNDYKFVITVYDSKRGNNYRVCNPVTLRFLR